MADDGHIGSQDRANDFPAGAGKDGAAHRDNRGVAGHATARFLTYAAHVAEIQIPVRVRRSAHANDTRSASRNASARLWSPTAPKDSLRPRVPAGPARKKGFARLTAAPMLVAIDADHAIPRCARHAADTQPHNRPSTATPVGNSAEKLAIMKQLCHSVTANQAASPPWKRTVYHAGPARISGAVLPLASLLAPGGSLTVQLLPRRVTHGCLQLP